MSESVIALGSMNKYMVSFRLCVKSCVLCNVSVRFRNNIMMGMIFCVRVCVRGVVRCWSR